MAQESIGVPFVIKRTGGHRSNGSYHGHFSKLLLRPTSKKNGRRRIWVLERDFHVEVCFAGGSLVITVPHGFETDLASIPMVAQLFLGGRDDYAEEAVVHDFLCVEKMPRFFTNSTMRVLMKLLDRPHWKILCVFYALMVFGYGSPIFNFFNRSGK